MRPYLPKPGESDLFSADPAATELKFCGGSNWKNCKEQCRCQEKCAALRAKIGWPADLPCIDPNDKGTTMNTQWMRDFLSFAKTRGWITEGQLASQASRCALLVLDYHQQAGCVQKLG